MQTAIKQALSSDHEIWRLIVGCEGRYEISNYGRIKIISCRSKKFEGQFMQQSINRKGYCQVSLRSIGGKKNRLVHALVAEAFIGPRPKGRQVAHNDGVKTHNLYSNLRYATPIENISDRELHGHTIKGSNQAGSKIDEIKAGIIYKLKGAGISSTDIGLISGLSNTNILKIWNKQLWKHATE